MIGATTHFVPLLLLTHNELLDSLTHFTKLLVQLDETPIARHTQHQISPIHFPKGGLVVRTRTSVGVGIVSE